MANYLQEAFKKLDILEEEAFTTDEKGFGELKDFINDDDVSDDVVVIDGEAEVEDEIKDSYIGKKILDCCVCHSKIFEDEVKLDETGEWANVGKECPFCFSTDGFKVLGEVAPLDETKEEKEEEKVEIDDGEVEVEEKDENEEKFESFKRKLRERREKKLTNESKKPISKRPISERIDFDDDKFNFKFISKNTPVYDIYRKYDSHSSNVLTYFYKDVTLDDIYKGIKNGESIGKILVHNEKFTDSGIIDEICTILSKLYGDDKKDLVDLCKKNIKSEVKESKKSRKSKKSVDESVEVKATDESSVEVVKNDDGSLDVKVGASEEEFTEDEVIAPLSDESKEEIEANSKEETDEEEFEGEDDMIDIDMDEFEEEDFDELGESYLKKVYENVDSYKTTKVSSGNNKLKLEGIITFKSGNKKKTNFVFEAAEMTKKNKAKFIGENQQITRGNKAFTVTGTFKGNKFLAESLNYNYRAKGTDGKSKRIYGTVSKKNK